MREPVTFKKSRRERYRVRDDVGSRYKKDTLSQNGKMGIYTHFLLLFSILFF